MENLTNWCVYMHTNRENGKKYIGITSQKPTYRWNNGEGYKLNPHFYNAIKHYGWDSFAHDILFTGLTQDEAENLEVELIFKYKTQDPNIGYNHADGGRVNKGWHMSEESKRKISKAEKGHAVSAHTVERIRESQIGNKHWLGKHHSNKTKQKLSALRSGSGNGMYGKKHPEEVKEKISEAMAGRTLSQETRNKIGASKIGGKNYNAQKVICVETGAVYDSMTDAASNTGITKHGISKACRGKLLTSGGFHWKCAEAVSTSG